MGTRLDYYNIPLAASSEQGATHRDFMALSVCSWLRVHAQLHLYWSLLRPGGVLLGDDIDVSDAVRHDVRQFAACHNLSIQLFAPNEYLIQKKV